MGNLQGWNLAFVIILVILITLILVGVVALVVKWVRVENFKLKPNRDEAQLPELVDFKVFRTADSTALAWYGNIKPNSKEIILGIHDLALGGLEFDWMAEHYANNTNVSFVTYDQRFFGLNDNQELDRRMSYSFQDLGQIVTYLKTTYPDKALYLCGSGFGANLATYYAAKHGLDLAGLITLNMDTHFQFRNGGRVFLGFLGSPEKQLLQLPFVGSDYTIDPDMALKLDNLFQAKGMMNIYEYLQTQVTIRRSLKSAGKIVCPILLLNSETSKMTSMKGLDRFFDHVLSVKKRWGTNLTYQSLPLSIDQQIVAQINQWKEEI